MKITGWFRKLQARRFGRSSGTHPRTALLREGFDAGHPYFVNEEEVPPVRHPPDRLLQSHRWRDGRVVVWLSTLRGSGRGEGSGGLALDLLVNTPAGHR